MYDLDKCKKIEIPQGAFYIGLSSKEQSVGYLKLKPKQSLKLHNRPTGIERLTQIEGKCNMVIYDSDTGRTITLKRGDKLKIAPPGTWHIHVNPFNEPSLTYWDFEGDITQIIENIKKGGAK